MVTWKSLTPYILASLAGHALLFLLTVRFDWAIAPVPPPPKLMTIELKAPPKKEARRPSVRRVAQREQREQGAERQVAEPDAIAAPGEGTADLRRDGGPYYLYLLQVRRKIERLWRYPQQAITAGMEGDVEIRFTIDETGRLAESSVTTPSGSLVLDQGALAVVKAASPYAPLPAEYNLSRLHITATFSYRLDE